MGTTVRIAVAQISYLPAYVTPNNDYLDEPAPPIFDGDEAPIAGRIRTAQGLAAAISEIRSAHLADLEAKLTVSVQHAMLHRADLLVFPEYSVPPELLPTLNRIVATGATTVVAGTHSVRTSQDVRAAYRTCKLTELADSAAKHARKAVVPILRPDGTNEYRFKRTRSKWEHDLVLDDAPSEPITLTIGGSQVNVHLSICIDALTQQLPLGRGSILVVPALSPTSDIFHDLFGCAIAREVACVISNSASFGGSTVVTRQLQNPSDFAALQKLPTGEAVLVVDVDVDAQFGKSGSVVTEIPSQLVARGPFLYRRATADAHLVESLDSFASMNDEQLVTLARTYAEDDTTPGPLQENLSKLQFGLAAGTLNEDEIELLTSFVSVPETCLPFPNRCVQALTTLGRAIGTLISSDPSNEEALAAATRIPSLLRRYKAAAHELTSGAPAISAASVQAKAPFVDRDREQEALRRHLDSEHVVVQGLPGIGKTALVENVIAEVFPGLAPDTVHCVEGTTPDDVRRSIEARIGLTTEDLEKLPHGVRTALKRVVIVHSAHHAFGQAVATDSFARLLRIIAGSRIRIVLVAERRVSAPISATIDVRALPTPDTVRLIDYYCRAYQVTPPAELAENLHGYPQAVIFACDLLRAGAGKPIERIRFFKDLRKEILETVMRGLVLERAEQDVLLGLAVMRRPFAPELISRLEFPGLTDLPGVLATLERRFLIERTTTHVFVADFVRDTAIKEWGAGRNLAPFHKKAAAFFEARITSSDAVERFDALEESVFHWQMAGDYVRARQLGGNWMTEARAAISELVRRRQHARIVALADAVAIATSQVDTLRFFESHAVSALARQRRFADAKKRLENLRSLGTVDIRVLTTLGRELAAHGAPTEALEFLNEAHQANPTDGYVLAVIADVHLGLGDLDRADDIAEMALEHAPSTLYVLDIASRVARLKGEPERAYKLAREAMTINPQRAEQTFNKARSAVRKRYGGKIPPNLE